MYACMSLLQWLTMMYTKTDIKHTTHLMLESLMSLWSMDLSILHILLLHKHSVCRLNVIFAEVH